MYRRYLTLGIIISEVSDTSLVLCEVFNPDGTPVKTNHRQAAYDIFENYQKTKPWYGLEQEFYLMKRKTGNVLPSGKTGEDPVDPQGHYYCSVGSANAYGREFVEESVRLALIAGLVSGINAILHIILT